MKNKVRVILFAALIVFSSVSLFAQDGPKDPSGPGNGILGVGIGPGMGYYGGGVGPAFVVHYDHGIWQVGPGTISLGGQFGTSFAWNSGNEFWTNTGFVGRAAYHYGWDVPGLDTYAGFGAGTVINFYSTDNVNSNKSTTHVGFLPTFFFGGSYYFNDIVGLNAEMGYNFTFFSFGVNFRIIR